MLIEAIEVVGTEVGEGDGALQHVEAASRARPGFMPSHRDGICLRRFLPEPSRVPPSMQTKRSPKPNVRRPITKAAAWWREKPRRRAYFTPPMTLVKAGST